MANQGSAPGAFTMFDLRIDTGFGTIIDGIQSIPEFYDIPLHLSYYYIYILTYNNMFLFESYLLNAAHQTQHKIHNLNMQKSDITIRLMQPSNFSALRLLHVEQKPNFVAAHPSNLPLYSKWVFAKTRLSSNVKRSHLYNIEYQKETQYKGLWTIYIFLQIV